MYSPVVITSSEAPPFRPTVTLFNDAAGSPAPLTAPTSVAATMALNESLAPSVVTVLRHFLSIFYIIKVSKESIIEQSLKFRVNC